MTMSEHSGPDYIPPNVPPAAAPIPSAQPPADLKDALLGAMFAANNSQSDQRVDYAADVKPWLGSSAAVAVFVDANQQLQSVGILQVTDATQAKASLTKLVTSGSGGSVTGY